MPVYLDPRQGAPAQPRHGIRRCPHRALALVLLILFVAGARSAMGEEEYWLYTVRPGDNLWKVSQEHLWHFRYYRRLQELNRVEDPRRLKPGTHLRIPVRWLRHEPVPVLVGTVSGDVWLFASDNGSARPAVTGAAVHMGDKLVTGADGNVLLHFADGSTMAVRSQSELEMDTLRVYGRSGMVDTRMRLQRGRTDSRAEPARGPASRYQITTPAAVTAVRGTRFRVAARGERAETLNEVLTGTVMVTGEHGTVAVEAGSGYVATRDVTRTEADPADGARSDLLLPPVLDPLPERIESFPARLRWPARESAAGYRVQIGDDDELIHLYVDRLVAGNTAQINELPDGWHTIVVRSVAADGLEGPDALARVQVEAPPPPPALLTPGDESWWPDPYPMLTWTDTPRGRAYRLQVARDPGFGTLEREREIPRGGGYRLIEPLTGGSWWWRVATIDQFRQVGPWSPARQLNVLGTPELLPAATQGEPLGFGWRYPDANASVKWDFQLARDGAFTDVLRRFRTDSREAELYQVPSGRYHARVRAVGADGTPGQWSASREIEVPKHEWWKRVPLILVPLIL